MLFFCFFLLVVLIQLLFFLSRFKRVKPDTVLIVYGKVDPDNKEEFKIYHSGGVFVWPVIQKYEFLHTGNYTLRTEFSIASHGHLKVEIRTVIKPDLSQVSGFVKKHFALSKSEIESQTTALIKLRSEDFLQSRSYDQSDRSELLALLRLELETMLLQQGFKAPLALICRFV